MSDASEALAKCSINLAVTLIETLARKGVFDREELARLMGALGGNPGSIDMISLPSVANAWRKEQIARINHVRAHLSSDQTPD